MSFLNRFQSALESLYELPENAKYVIAYSGGVDSHVLLYCCAQLQLPIRAIHIHHGLQSIADDWVDHCQRICEQLNIHLDVVYVNVKQTKGKSPEEVARDARYEALSLNLNNGDCLITAQHQSDQAETLLLQLCRTASAAGLSSMPDKKQLKNNLHIRPLLGFSRNEIVNFAGESQLHWIEDPSNKDVAFDRNFLRKEVMPLLRERWPEIEAQFSIVTKMQSNNLIVLEDMAAIDLSRAVISSYFQSKLAAYDVSSVLSIDVLKTLSKERLSNLLRYWVIKEIKASPTRNLLHEIETTIVNSQQDVNAVITYLGFECRKYQDKLYMLKRKNDLESVDNIAWKPKVALQLIQKNVQFVSVSRFGSGLRPDLLNKPLKVCFRQGGEKFHPHNRKHSQSLKKLLQEEGIPPWERGSFPLLYCDDELIAVIGLWMSKQHVVTCDEDGWVIDIEKL